MHISRFGKVCLLATLGVVCAALVAIAVTAPESRTVYFDLDCTVIRADAVPVLEEVLALLRTHPTATADVDGHTCILGGHAYNVVLSQRRAEAVAAWLAARGIDRGRLAVHGYGPDRPALANLNIFNRRRNRRVEIVLHLPAPSAAASAAAPATPPAPVPVEREVTAAIVSPTGEFVGDLPREAFSVRENGVPREILSVTPVTSSAAGSGAVLLDHSGSMGLRDLQYAVSEFANLMPGDARVAVAALNDRLTRLAPAADATALRRSTTALARGGATHLYDLLIEYINRDLSTRPGPRVIVLFSDGLDEGIIRRRGSVNPSAAVIAAARRHAVRIAAVELGPTCPEARQALQELAAQTDGTHLVYDPYAGGSQFAPAWRLLGVEARSGSYRIRYRSEEGVAGPVEVQSPGGRATDILPLH